ncbi:MAG: peptide chain release factor N(5)-glutamine methyltransferase [Cyanobacteriota bacterium]|nr:peptide chain release factor N(5)-glutamine methyltransferase [Cyanobacteriota bacterium]
MERLTGTELLSWRQDLLRLGGEAQALDWLLDMAAGLSPSGLQTLRLDPHRPIDLPLPLGDLERLWQEHLASSAPLQYLVGRCCWRTFEMAVGPAVLIPRPETELLIDLATTMPPPSDLLWADLGTGSGCLAMALAEAWPTSQGLAVDLSGEALSQARINLHHAGVGHQVQLVQGSWFGALQPWWGRLQLVVSNPPYIPSHEIDELDPVVRDHEPRLALDGGHDGLSSIRTIAEEAPSALAPGGWLLLEHHHVQSEQVLSLLDEKGLVDCQFHLDLEGNKRFASARQP